MNSFSFCLKILSLSFNSKVEIEPLFEFSEPCSKFPLALYFTYGNYTFLLPGYESVNFIPLLAEKFGICGILDQRNSSFSAGFPGDSVVKNLPANAVDVGDAGLISELERSPGGGNDNPLQYSCQYKPMDEKPGSPQTRQGECFLVFGNLSS
ncbi:hypothetical protein MG293_000506 [Ovis ammon polii]|uniref:Uncharacterized protein n=1 Tax=Ovis ammon polii TaxID=230172 RepID=A0AAD4UMZ9_OVIAM|nr:hypothetical protein MG293_000506 [Ovis ammon polii]